MVGGGTLNGVTLAGGTLEIDAGVTVGELGDSDHVTGKIAGLATSAQVIDLVDIAVSSSGTTLGYSGNTLSGTLTVNDGTHVATLALIGNYIAASFHLAADGNGGTFVTDPPVDNSGL